MRPEIGKYCPKCGGILHYDQGVIECSDCSWWCFDKEVKKEPKPEKKQIDVIYICNRTRCEHCTWPVCQHTTDIKYAANFVNEDGYWKEVVRKDEE